MSHTVFCQMDRVPAPILLDPVSVFSKAFQFGLSLQAQLPRPTEWSAQILRLDHNCRPSVGFKIGFIQEASPDRAQIRLLPGGLPERNDLQTFNVAGGNVRENVRDVPGRATIGSIRARRLVQKDEGAAGQLILDNLMRPHSGCIES